MLKIYEADSTEKEGYIDLDNDIMAFDRKDYFDENTTRINEMVMIGRTKQIPFNSYVDIHWSLNGIKSNNEDGEVIIFEPLQMQINNKIANISETDTYFDGKIKLSSKSIILIPSKMYNELNKDPDIRKKLKKVNLRIYEGNEKLAVKMIFYDKSFVYIDIDKEGYVLDYENHPDRIKYTNRLVEKQKELVEVLQGQGRNVTYKKKQEYRNIEKETYEVEFDEEEKEIEDIQEDSNYKIISGLTKKVEGSINIDDELYATTDIGKIRENQEDAILLIKDKEIPKFKMMVVADGMGGWSNGEVASNIIVNKLKEWFENLNEKEKKCFYNGIGGLRKSLQKTIKNDIQSDVLDKTKFLGGSTLVCAVVGKDETLIANIGDSRAYYIKNGKIEQISREDTVSYEKLEQGKLPSKEATRFDRDSNQLVQCIGMNKKELKSPHMQVIKNNEYDMILLFSDGVTDCLSDEDIAVVCKNSDKKELTNKIVEKAIRHDSIEPEEYIDYIDMNYYIPGGKDNTTAVAYIPKENDDNELEK